MESSISVIAVEKSTMSSKRIETKILTKRALGKKVAASEDHVRVLRLDEYKEAALTLAQAFATDHVARYFIDVPDREYWSEQQKWDLHLSIMEYVVYGTILKGLATTVGPNYGAVALWMPPGKNMDDLWTLIRTGMWRLHYQLSREGKTRFFTEFLPLLHDTKLRVLGARDEDSWYLYYLGTRPEAQGHGFAKKLIKHVTDIADAEGLPCYLESSNPCNPAIYRKYGFTIARTIHLQRAEKKNVELDIMVREPMPSVAVELSSAEEKTAETQSVPQVVDIVIA